MNRKQYTKGNNDDDLNLLTRVLRQQDPVAMAVLYEKFRACIGRYLHHHVASNDEIMDLIEEVFTCVWQGQCAYDGRSDVQIYLLGIARNIARKHQHREQKRVAVHSSLRTAASRLSTGKLVDSLYDPEKAIQSKEIQDKLLKTLRRLPQKCCQALELVYIQDLRPYEAAARIGCPFPVFRNRMQYGLTKLRQELGDVDGLTD